MTRIVLVCTLALLATACGSGRAGDGRLRAVASTNVYGDIVRQIGGPHVSVTSVISAPDADPHLYEPGTANGLAVARAAVVVQNGLGYDSFMDRLERSAPSGSRRVVIVADAIGLPDGANPHAWYDVPALPRVASAIEHALAAADPTHETDYADGRARFVASLRPLQRAVRAILRTHASTPIAWTEPLPRYLADAAGLVNEAPQSFTHPIEEGTEPPPGAVAQMTRVVTGRRVRVLLYNRQAVSPITARVRAAAERAGVPVVGLTETLPAGLTFQAWMLQQVRAIGGALAR